MSAAGPLPPPYPSSNKQPNCHSSEERPSSSNADTGNGERVFAHIQDLQAQALTDFSRQQSLKQLHERADQALNQAKSYIDFRRPDLAFVEYLRAYEIAVEVLPRHKDYIHFIHDQHGEQKLAILQRRISSMDEKFETIKRMIINNNTRSGVKPVSQRASSGHSRAGSDGVHKDKPSVAPKPEILHSRTINKASTTSKMEAAPVDALAERFARIRGSSQADPRRSSSRASTSSVNSLPLSMPSEGDFGGASGRPSMELNFPPSKPQGPRSRPDAMPGPPRPSKLSLDPQIGSALPKPPSPTYSPARNMQTTGNIVAPRHSARSLAGINSRKSSLTPASPASYVTQNGTTDHFPSTSNNTTSGAGLRRKSVHMPKETHINAERLYDYLERYNILLIDFRPREDFDQGHLHRRNVICIDPLIMRQGISAEEVLDKLVLSPEDEQQLFYRRDQFDLVVYYDTQTQTESYPMRPANENETRLKYLHEALYEFNQDKPLQRPPIFLQGGIDAWVDLVGNQALATSDTQARIKTGRPIQRRLLSRDGQLKLPKRRLRDYNPFDPEEVQKWRDRAMSESVPEATGLVTQVEEDEESAADNETDGMPSYPTIEEFNARFPEAGSLGIQSPNNASVRQPPERPAKVPMYPNTPAPSVYPQPPTRPAPAAPRMSYTGVSDRAVSQTPQRSSSQLAPYIPPKFMSANLRLPRTGIYNFGNTCYMNATLQALSATFPLSVLFLSDQYKKMVQKDNWKGSRGLLPEIYNNVVRSLWKDDVTFIKPTTFRTFCGRLNSMFNDPSQQQDAQEFFSFLVDTLHEDFNENWARTPLRMLTEEEEAKRERQPRVIVAKTEWARWTHRENSFVTSLFYGQQSSRLRCQKCGSTSTTYEPWAILPVEIPDGEQTTTLQSCLRSHMQDELLDESNQWECPRCKVHRSATKKFTITRMPPFMVLQLKRFITNPRTGDQRKKTIRVRFPLDHLDMEEFVLPQPSSREAQDIATMYGPDALKTDQALTPPYVYDAYAVVRHHGNSTRSGHYTCAVKDRVRGCWRYFNDQSATDFQAENLPSGRELDNDQAYMIFYQRRQPGEQR